MVTSFKGGFNVRSQANKKKNKYVSNRVLIQIYLSFCFKVNIFGFIYLLLQLVISRDVWLLLVIVSSFWSSFF